MAEERISFRRDDDEHRYEVLVDGELAGVSQFRADPKRVVFTHTVVLPSFDGRGLGSRLAAYALDDVIASGRSIVPVCPFIAAYVTRHEDYLPSVVWPPASD